MSDAPADRSITYATNTELLANLRSSSNETAWQCYADRYRPLIVGYAERLGLPHDAAEDAAQQTLVAFCTSLRSGQYDRTVGRLRTWLFGIAHRCVLAARRGTARQAAREPRADVVRLDAIEDADRLQDLWDQEWRDALVQRCLETVRGEVEPKTFEAFRLLVWEELSGAEVAARLGLSENAVYGAKRRIFARVRELLPLFEETW